MCGLLLGRLRALSPGSRDHLVSPASFFPQCASLLRITGRVPSSLGYHPPELAVLHCETGGKDHLSLRHQGRSLDNVRLLLNTVQALLVLIISLSFKQPIFPYKCAEVREFRTINTLMALRPFPGVPATLNKGIPAKQHTLFPCSRTSCFEKSTDIMRKQHYNHDLLLKHNSNS
jgi:hypothetical protein